LTAIRLNSFQPLPEEGMLIAFDRSSAGMLLLANNSPHDLVRDEQNSNQGVGFASGGGKANVK
jgi:hypothetical protein